MAIFNVFKVIGDGRMDLDSNSLGRTMFNMSSKKFEIVKRFRKHNIQYVYKIIGDDRMTET